MATPRPDIDLDSDAHKQSQLMAANTLSFLVPMSEDETLASMSDMQAEPSKDHKINCYDGVYRLHIVSEPPEEVTHATRTAGIEFDNGEFFMLGIYHSHDGQRPVCAGGSAVLSSLLWCRTDGTDGDVGCSTRWRKRGSAMDGACACLPERNTP